MNKVQVIFCLGIFVFLSLSCYGQFKNSDRKVMLICTIAQINGECFLNIELENISSGEIKIVVDNSIRTERPNRDIGLLVEPQYTAAGVVQLSSFCSLELVTVSPGGVRMVKKVKLSKIPENSIRVVFVVHEDFTNWFNAWSGALVCELSIDTVERLERKPDQGEHKGSTSP